MTALAGKRRVVHGIEHGLSGYTNHECRCEVCTEANTQQARRYRQRRFAGSPLCAVGKCQYHQSPSYGHGLCYHHGAQMGALRERLRRASRSTLKKFIKKNGLKIKIYRRTTDDEIRDLIMQKVIERMTS